MVKRWQNSVKTTLKSFPAIQQQSPPTGSGGNLSGRKSLPTKNSPLSVSGASLFRSGEQITSKTEAFFCQNTPFSELLAIIGFGLEQI